MNSTDRKQRIDDLLLMIGGLEVAILEAIKQDDKKFEKSMEELKAKYIERLRRVSYGLPEESTIPTED